MAIYFQEKKFSLRFSKDVYEFLKNLGQERKKFIVTCVYLRFPDAFDELVMSEKKCYRTPFLDNDLTAVRSQELLSKINSYREHNIIAYGDFEFDITFSVKQNYAEAYTYFILLLLGDCKSAFLEDLLKEAYGKLIQNPKTIAHPIFSEWTAREKKKSPAPVQAVTHTPAPIVQTSVQSVVREPVEEDEDDALASFKTEKKKYSEEEIMKKLAQAEAEANAEDEDDEPAEEPVVKIPIDPMIEAGLHLFDDADSEPTDESELPFR